MHETRFINEIFDILKQKLDDRAVLEQVVVNVRLSPFSHVTPDNLQASFDELKGEGLRNVRIKVLPLEVSLDCNACKRESRATKKIFGCPFCGSADVNIQMDKEFFVESIEIGDPSP